MVSVVRHGLMDVALGWEGGSSTVPLPLLVWEIIGPNIQRVLIKQRNYVGALFLFYCHNHICKPQTPRLLWRFSPKTEKLSYPSCRSGLMSDNTRCMAEGGRRGGGGGVCGLMEIGAERRDQSPTRSPIIKHGWGMTDHEPGRNF